MKQTGLLNEEGVVKIFKSFDSQNKGYLIKSDFEKSLGKISDEVRSLGILGMDGVYRRVQIQIQLQKLDN